MGNLIEKYKEEMESNPEFNQILYELNHYLKEKNKGTKRSLREKLEQAEIDEDEIEEAEELKQRASQKIMRFTFSENAQKIFALLLGEICENFRYKIYPLIKQGKDEAEIQEAIKDKVLGPAIDFLEENVLDLYHMDIRAMLYFLTGNCHIEWQK